MNTRSITYHPSILSEGEKERFRIALGDGFGGSHRRKHLEEAALPAEIEPGLLEHKAYYAKDRDSTYFHGEEKEDAEEDEFWNVSDGDSPPGLCEQSPLNFHLPALREYFQEQKAAYLNYARSLRNYGGLDDWTPEERDNYIYRGVLGKTYTKPWYEYHINEHIYFVKESVAQLDREVKEGSKLGFTVLMIVSTSAELGRLIEQYYWKFLIEPSAIRGVKTIKAAKAGGAAHATVRQAEHAKWKAEADRIRKAKPALLKKAVASQVQENLRITQSIKHIARVLTRP